MAESLIFIISVALGLCVAMLILIQFTIYRNMKVFEYRNKVIDYAYDQAQIKDHDKIHAEYKRVPYQDMTRKFWKPCHSFFDKNIIPKL